MTLTAKELALREQLASGRFHQFLGLELISTDVQKQEIILRLPFKAEFERLAGTGQIHGGVISALIDIAGDFAFIMLLERVVPTVNLRVDYLSMAVCTDLVAAARVLRAGRSVGVVDIEIADSAGKLIAIGRGSYSTLNR